MITDLQTLILATCSNADPEPLRASEIWQKVALSLVGVSMTETIFAIIELENDGYLQTDKHLLTKKGKLHIVGVMAEQLAETFPKKSEFAGEDDAPNIRQSGDSGGAGVEASSPLKESALSFIERMCPEITRTAERLQDVCLFFDCGRLAHRTCPCGARTCYEHMYTAMGQLCPRDEQGFCADCQELIEQESYGVARYGHCR